MILRRRIFEKIIHCVLFFCGFLSVVTTGGIVLVLATETFSFFREVSLGEFLTDTQWTPLFAEKHFGILPLICGTVVVSVIAILVALPMGLLIAIYLSEFASASIKRLIKPFLEVLAGVPSIVYGYFALLFVTPLLRTVIPSLAGFNALSPGLVMGIMIIPIVASLSEDALSSVPLSFKEGSYALGSSRLQMVFKVLLPAASGGIVASFILAMSRAVGETMIVAIAAGQQPVLTVNPLNSIETMTAYIVQVSLGDTPHGTLEYNTIFAVGMMLFILTLALNSMSMWLKGRFMRYHV